MNTLEGLIPPINANIQHTEGNFFVEPGFGRYIYQKTSNLSLQPQPEEAEMCEISS